MSIEYVMNGAIDVEQDGRNFHVLPDTVAILRLGAAQRLRFSGAAYNEKIYLVVGGDVAAQIISSLPTVVTPPQGSPIKQMFQNVFEQVKTFDLEATLRASDLTYGILVRLSEYAALQRNQPTEIEPLQDAISFMHTHIHEVLSVQQVASAACLSVSHLQHLFTKLMGMSPMSYHRQLKIELACSYLTHTDITCKQIAATLAYRNPLYFCAIFKRTMGVSPTAFRNSCKDQSMKEFCRSAVKV